MAEAEDVVSETFLVCWRRLDAVPADAVPWLLGVARKVLANHWRSRRRQEALRVRVEDDSLSWEPAPTGSVGSIEPHKPLMEALARLGERDREVLLLVAWDELTCREGAKVLGCTPTAFTVRLHRARKRLLKEIEGIRTPTIVKEAPGIEAPGIGEAQHERGPE